MARESASALATRVAAIMGRLRAAYPDAHCELDFANPLQLLVATILSAQCTDRQVNIVTRDLFRKYRSAQDFAHASLSELEQDIRRIGLFRNKARNIQAACRALVANHGGDVPRSLEELVALAGVGRKTANVVLGTAFDIASGIVVDTHVARLSQRLGLTRETDPGKIERRLLQLIPRESWTVFSHWLIWHGRRRCDARNPECAACEIRDLCPSAPAMTASRLLMYSSGPGDPAWNMAADEALLATAAPRNAPVLRFYAWTEPAATFGYFQHYADVEGRTRLRPLIRRPTGGGIVPHDRDWTYSLAIPPGHAWHRLKAIESYRTIHEWVIRALEAIGVSAELATCCRKEVPGACFEGYEQFDVLWRGRKIAGAAQRRNASGLLIQGSVQPPPNAGRTGWESSMASQAPTTLFADTGSFSPDEAFLDAVRNLIETKYGDPGYNRQR